MKMRFSILLLCLLAVTISCTYAKKKGAKRSDDKYPCVKVARCSAGARKFALPRGGFGCCRGKDQANFNVRTKSCTCSRASASKGKERKQEKKKVLRKPAETPNNQPGDDQSVNQKDNDDYFLNTPPPRGGNNDWVYPEMPVYGQDFETESPEVVKRSDERFITGAPYDGKDWVYPKMPVYGQDFETESPF